MSEIIIYENPDIAKPVQVTLEGETVWLTQEQMAKFFGRERSVITRMSTISFARANMPNHVHFVLVNLGRTCVSALKMERRPPKMYGHMVLGRRMGNSRAPVVNRAPTRGAPTVDNCWGIYKSLCVHHGLKWIKQNQPSAILGKLWQRN